MTRTESTRKRSVLITGGTGSIGQVLVTQFSSDFNVTFSYCHREALALSLAQKTKAMPIRLDLTEPEIPSMDWHYDVLINNAAVNTSRVPIADVAYDELLSTFATNFFGPFRLCQLALRHMQPQRFGRIININSLYGLKASVGNGPYTGSKHALSGLTKTIAREYASFGITSNEICPGAVESDLMIRIAAYVHDTQGITVDDYLQHVRERSPSGRMTKASEIAGVALFLASDAASHVNGVSLIVDGGISS